MEEVINNLKITKSTHLLPKWKGVPIKDTYGGKGILNKNGKPVFAEIYALMEFIERDYDIVWVDSFRRKYSVDIPETSLVKDSPSTINEKLLDINGGKWGGTWDLLLWKENEIRFVKLKRKKNDKIRDSQVAFLERALALGYSVDNFEVYEWDFEEE